MSMPTLTYSAPTSGLAQYLSFFYEFQTFDAHFDDVDRADYAQLRFIIRGSNGQFTFIDGHRQTMPAVHIVGPTTGNSQVSGDGPIFVFGVGLLPNGWAAIMPIEASAAVNRVFDATELFGAIISKSFAALQAAPSAEARLAIGNRLIDQLISVEDSAARRFTAMVDAWLARSLSPDVAHLVRGSGLSRRQVERYCNRYYGAPPRLLARKYRATRAAVALARGEATADDFIAQGFYDQSHFIRELRHFTGLTPTTIQENLPSLTRLTIARTDHPGISPLAEGLALPKRP